MTEDAKGQYPGLAHRNPADLEAWLEKRPREAALEPESADHRSAPSFLGHAAARPLFAARIAGRYGGGGHNIVSTVFLECRAMYRKDGPREMAPVGEVEFVNGIAAMSASGSYGPCRVAEAIIGHADLTLGAPRARGAGGRDQAWRRAVPRHPLRRVLGRQRGDPEIRHLASCRRIWCAIRNSARALPSWRRSA